MSSLATRDEIMAQAARMPAASQATSIEQSRAVAEVQAAVVIAQQRPRDEARALEKALTSCRTKELAEVAFFKFPRGGQTVTGESIHLAIELARCFGNISYGIKELDRDDARKMSEMLAYAWDLETNTRSEMTFLVPHKMDTKQGAKTLVDMRDIYENNANNGARRLRECIFRVLPPYLKESAKSACYEALKTGQNDKPLTVRITEAVEAFRKSGIAVDRLEAKMGPKANWTEMDIANLEVSYRSIQRREVSAEEEFPRPATMSRDDALKQVRSVMAKDDPAQQSRNQPADTITPESPNAEEGPADEQRGEAHSNVDARLVLIDQIRDEAAAASTLAEISAVYAKHMASIESLPDDLANEANTIIDNRTSELKGGQQ